MEEANLSLYNISFSKKIIGLGSLIADFKRPLASFAENGWITFKPGTWAYQD